MIFFVVVARRTVHTHIDSFLIASIHIRNSVVFYHLHFIPFSSNGKIDATTKKKNRKKFNLFSTSSQSTDTTTFIQYSDWIFLQLCVQLYSTSSSILTHIYSGFLISFIRIDLFIDAGFIRNRLAIIKFIQANPTMRKHAPESKQICARET